MRKLVVTINDSAVMPRLKSAYQAVERRRACCRYA